jgi:O-antigen ligase
VLLVIKRLQFKLLLVGKVVRSFLSEVFSHIDIPNFRLKDFAYLIFIVIASLIIALLILTMGIKSLPIVFFVLLVLPWLIKNPFRIFIWLIITWPILTLFIRIPLPAGIPDFSYDRVLILLLLIVVILEALLSKRRLMKVTHLDVLIIIYVIVQIITRLHVIWFGGEGDADINGFLSVILIPIALYWTVKNLLESKEDLKWLLYALLIASFLVCLTGLFEQALGTRIFKTSLELGGYEVAYQWQDAQGGLRAAGALGNPAIYGAFLGMGCLAGISLLSLEKRRPIQIALLATIGILLFGVLASFTRSAWLSVVIVLFFAQFFIHDLWKKTLPIIIVSVSILVTIWNLVPDSSKIIQRALTTKTISQRFELFSIGFPRFMEKPILGWGAGALNVFNMVAEGDTSHNMYLTFMVDGGVVLFISFCAVIGYLLIRAIRIYGKTEKGSLERNVLITIMGSILIFLLSGLALELRYFGYFNSVFWICAGVIDCLGEKYCTI